MRVDDGPLPHVLSAEPAAAMDDWERHVTPLLQDMGCPADDAQDDFFHQQDVSAAPAPTPDRAPTPA